MRQELEQAIANVIQDLFSIDTGVELTRPDEQFGDFATNIALQLSKQLGKNPREVAEAIKTALEQSLDESVEKITVAGPGFLNLTVRNTVLWQTASQDVSHLHDGQRVLLEYSCPNAFKELHTGHLYQTVAGDAIGRILSATGANVYRANFGGDVGLHVAKCLYGITVTLGGEKPEALEAIPVETRAEWLSASYVKGARAYETDEAAKAAIITTNNTVYNFHASQDHDSPLAQIYWTCREWSYDYFKTFYDRIGVLPFDKYYPESTTTDRGTETVKAHLGSVFSESDGAVVYEGEKVGLHTRVYITSQGLPTYETKDTGVIFSEADDFPYDRRILMTGNDQTEYMKVVFAALREIDADLAAKQVHLTNGTVRFGSGQKMSSRLGNVTRAVDVLETVKQTVSTQRPDSDENSVSLAAVKYSFLKHRLGGDISFDVNESVSLEGNSGPYLQYAHARARSILTKRENVEVANDPNDLQPGERSLLRSLSEYGECLSRSATEFMPHHICTYLYELAQKFNQFYEHNRVIGDEREALRITLVERYADTLKNGLNLLGITAPDSM